MGFGSITWLCKAPERIAAVCLLLLVAAPAAAEPGPVIIVGFTGGMEGRDSRVSGVVRIREAVIRELDASPGVLALTYNNFHWREAVRDVLALARPPDLAESAGAEIAGATPPLPRPAIIVYGHSWGGASIGKFSRALRAAGVEIALAVYIDVFAVRNPRVPDNVRTAVNFYQRTGLLRGLPLRGKRHLISEGRETALVGSFELKPQTEHFGWNWNLIQPLLYRHHHRIGHDLRVRRYLVEAAAWYREAARRDVPAASGSPSLE